MVVAVVMVVVVMVVVMVVMVVVVVIVMLVVMVVFPFLHLPHHLVPPLPPHFFFFPPHPFTFLPSTGMMETAWPGYSPASPYPPHYLGSSLSACPSSAHHSHLTPTLPPTTQRSATTQEAATAAAAAAAAASSNHLSRKSSE